MNHQYDEFTAFANLLADESAKILNNYFRTKIKIENKEDNTPVTIADQNTELKIRDLITKHYPTHCILGEEFDNFDGGSEFTWVIDPIDGTRSFIAGHKDYGTLIALLHNNKPIIGIINCPAHNERWVGIKDKQTTLNNKKIKTSSVQTIKDSYLFTSGIYFDEPILRNGFEIIKEKSKYYRYGGDCYMYGMLASGLIDVVIEDTLKAHDYMALVNVIEGAGGKITDKYGKDVSINSDGSLVASCNIKIHQELISIINN
ncbi:MAG: histidinol phosphate phosphatase [Rickettsiales bacterium]|nr:histidinol phosphate phosphatase [Rickettsiales bacterium]